MESDDVVIKRLLSRESGPKLPHDVVFVFNQDAGKIVEMSAEKVITSVNDKRFSQVFDPSVQRETKPEVRVFAIEPQEFTNLLRSVLGYSSHFVCSLPSSFFVSTQTALFE